MPTILLICDLDGTLIDSYPGIARAICKACDAVGVRLQTPLTRSIVGPPLDVMLQNVTHVRDATMLANLRQAFVAHYDQDGCHLSVAYPGINQMLQTIHASGCALTLATNKRFAPTMHILSTLGWTHWFSRIDSIDSGPKKTRTKPQMLDDVKKCYPLHHSFYLGDTSADRDAASTTGVPFIFAGWGSDAADDNWTHSAKTPSDVPHLVMTLASQF